MPKKSSTAKSRTSKSSTTKSSDSPGIFSIQLNKLFESNRRLDGREYTYAEVSRLIEERYKISIASSYVGKLRTGMESNPTRDIISPLARFFGVSPDYFFPECASTTHPPLEQQVYHLRALLRQAGVSDSLSTPIVALISNMVDEGNEQNAAKAQNTAEAQATAQANDSETAPSVDTKSDPSTDTKSESA